MRRFEASDNGGYSRMVMKIDGMGLGVWEQTTRMGRGVAREDMNRVPALQQRLNRLTTNESISTSDYH
jgi:hypothetical protein